MNLLSLRNSYRSPNLMSHSKSVGTLAVWDTTTVPEGIYTVRLTVTATDGHQTHDQVVLSVDRSPPQVISLTATETFMANGVYAFHLGNG